MERILDGSLFRISVSMGFLHTKVVVDLVMSYIYLAYALESCPFSFNSYFHSFPIHSFHISYSRAGRAKFFAPSPASAYHSFIDNRTF